MTAEQQAFFLSQSKTDWDRANAGRKPCNTCRHYSSITNNRWPLHVCNHPNLGSMSSMRQGVWIGLNAEVARTGHKTCGVEGTKWSPK